MAPIAAAMPMNEQMGARICPGGMLMLGITAIMVVLLVLLGVLLLLVLSTNL